MNNNLKDNRVTIEDAAIALWQGKGTAIEKLNETLVAVSNDILGRAEDLSEEDKLTTVNYIRDALADFEKACQARDDFMLADCLMYEWREIILIYMDEEQEG